MKLALLIFVFWTTNWPNVDSSSLIPTTDMLPDSYVRELRDIEGLRALQDKRPFIHAKPKFNVVDKRPFIHAKPKFNVVLTKDSNEDSNDYNRRWEFKRPFLHARPKFQTHKYKQPSIREDPDFNPKENEVDTESLYGEDYRYKRPFAHARPDFDLNIKGKRPFLQAMPEFNTDEINSQTLGQEQLSQPIQISESEWTEQKRPFAIDKDRSWLTEQKRPFKVDSDHSWLKQKRPFKVDSDHSWLTKQKRPFKVDSDHSWLNQKMSK